MAEEIVTLKKSTLWKASTGVLAVLLLISIITGGFGIKGGSSGGSPSAAPSPSPSPSPSGVGLVEAKKWVDDDPFLGDDDAPIIMIEFSDFQCPFCGRFRSQTFDQIKKDYIDTGKVKFVYRDFPLDSLHPQATPAAEAAECANEQGKFWEFHDKIFENQQSMSVNSYKQWAADLGLDTSKFNGCVDSRKYQDEVRKDLADAQASGGTGTPYFLVGNRPISGAQPYANFKAAIDAQL